VGVGEQTGKMLEKILAVYFRFSSVTKTLHGAPHLGRLLMKTLSEFRPPEKSRGSKSKYARLKTKGTEGKAKSEIQ